VGFPTCSDGREEGCQPQGASDTKEFIRMEWQTQLHRRVNGSTIRVDPGNFTLIVVLNDSIDQCFYRVPERSQLRERSREMVITLENRE
jgi:hypothetical protein